MINICKIAISALIVLLWHSSFATRDNLKRPNIIVILADDMGYSDLSCMGSEIHTPNIDALANNGILFTHFYNASRCCPTRASLLTGLYQTRAGMGDMNTTHLDVPEYQGTLSRNAVTIAEVLQKNGYRTIMTGKWHVGDESDNWPTKRGFERFFGIPSGGGLYFYPSKFLERPIYLNENKFIPDTGWYSTDGFTDYAIRFMDEALNDNKSFFLYQAYIAPHFPLQAKPEDIAAYKGRFDSGYDVIRTERFRRQKELGIIPAETECSPAEYPDWSTIENQAEESRKMEVYAAQIDCLDKNVGRITEFLKKRGIYNNTVIIFLSDNGACAEMVNRSPGIETGGAESFVSYGRNWANVSNTPYRLYKHFNHEGGILTPLVISWPDGILEKGRITDQHAIVNDILPTCLYFAGADYPAEYKGNKIFPVDGENIMPLINGAGKNRPLFFQHEGNAAIIKDNWKLVRRFKRDWELYNLNNDPTELHDMTKEEPFKREEMIKEYDEWSRLYGVLPWPLKK